MRFAALTGILRYSLFKLEIARLNHSGVLGQIRFEYRRKLVRRGIKRNHALNGQFFPNIGEADNSAEFTRQFFDDPPRRAGRSKTGLCHPPFESGQPALR